MFPLRDAENKKKLDRSMIPGVRGDDEQRPDRKASRYQTGHAASSGYTAFHSEIVSQKSGSAESVRFYLRLADDIGFTIPTHSVFRSPLCRTTTVEPYRPPEDATFRAINGLQQPRKYRLPMGCTHIHKLWKFSRSDFDWIISDLQSAETTSSHPNHRKRYCNDSPRLPYVLSPYLSNREVA
ncbi:hypothetical protein DAPPUDRAFT_264084 [Daphnia pulex]|uniref:Uncharacterized protein n=1 Tax=Daphnia pulex TaxID=6669 RepID=E9HQV2_DAPPU|nr:hypothetical protein DAPPUDRAFT_264084 [Daphnia pulex]|eukprot:EFX65883.1 hypothetical protein DAPPUDRAFT_264084 [Daphnia pulex]